MTLAVRPCPLCRSERIKTIGPILHPRPALVAGVELDLGGRDFWLRECLECKFQFKDPPIDPCVLMHCYAQADSDNWETDPDARTRKFDVFRRLLEKHAIGRRVLDVGCFNGALLSYLGNDWQRFGVEPSQAAAELARQRGVNILAPTLEELEANARDFDAILAIDVVEHVLEPLEFLCQTRERLAPGGVLLIVTGNSDALAWRLQESMYWYCSLPEHVSFYNRASLERIGREVGFELTEFRVMAHKRLSLLRQLSDMAKSAAYVVGRKARGFGLAPLRRLFVERRGPSIQSARDHFVAVLKKV